MSQLPVLPPELEEKIREGHSLARLKESEGYRAYLDNLDELRGSNYLDILNLTDREAVLMAVGEARALSRVRRLLDDGVAKGAALAAELDAAVERVRQGEAAYQRTFSPRGEPRFRRSVETG